MAEHDHIVQSVLQLPERERAEVARKILDSLNGTPDEEVERAWAQEVAKRLQDLTMDQAGSVSAEDALARARSRIAR